MCEEEFEEDWGFGDDDSEDDSADLAKPVAATAETVVVAAEVDEPSAPALPLPGCDDLGGAMAGVLVGDGAKEFVVMEVKMGTGVG